MLSLKACHAFTQAHTPGVSSSPAAQDMKQWDSATLTLALQKNGLATLADAMHQRGINGATFCLFYEAEQLPELYTLLAMPTPVDLIGQFMLESFFNSQGITKPT